VTDPDPTRIAARDVLLSDFLGNDSVYRFGYANPFNPDLGGTFFRLVDMLGDIRSGLVPGGRDGYDTDRMYNKEFSISYGFICPELSEKIVRWKNPRNPSYHRWDDGAAFDINFHSWTFGPYYVAPDLDTGPDNWAILSPLGIATNINQGFINGDFDEGLDRMITYSESPYICLARNQHPKAKWYENRFTGERGVKPLFLTHTGRARPTVPDNMADWRGGGWPSYHGSGRRQYHHIRTSMYTVMSDWLYDAIRVHNGMANKLPVSTTRHDWIVDCAIQAGACFDHLQALANGHVSIIAGLVTGRGGTSNWEEDGGWSFTVALPPNCEQADEIVDALHREREMYNILEIERLVDRSYCNFNGTALTIQQRRIRVSGVFDDDDARRFTRRFHLDRAATSPAFREGEGERSREGDPDPERVSNARPGTQATDARAPAGARRNLRTRVYRR
jgi:hypothetical protein